MITQPCRGRGGGGAAYVVFWWAVPAAFNCLVPGDRTIEDVIGCSSVWVPEPLAEIILPALGEYR
jgi:hypothetical protein